jgi:hypothetical protein
MVILFDDGDCWWTSATKFISPDYRAAGSATADSANTVYLYTNLDNQSGQQVDHLRLLDAKTLKFAASIA